MNNMIHFTRIYPYIGTCCVLSEGCLHPPESSVAVGTNQLLAPPDTEPLHFTRFVVYTQ
jgi:hypothetical protein